MRPAELWRRTLCRSDSRAVLGSAGLLLAAVALQAALLYAFVAMESLEEADGWLEHALRTSTWALRQQDPDGAVRALQGSFGELRPSLRVLGEQREVVASWGPWPEPAQSVAAVPGEDGRTLGALRLLRPGNHLVGELALAPGSTAQLALPLSHFAQETAEVGRGLAVVALVSGLVAALTAVAATTRLFAPLRQATRLVRDFDARRPGARLPTRNTGDPTDQHAEQLNRVLAGIDASFSRLRAFSSDVAHELRTPLNRISNVAEVALLGRDEAALRPALEAVQRSALELARMVQSLLLLAELDDRRLALRREVLDLEAWIAQVLEIYAPLFEEADVKLGLHSDAGSVGGDRVLLDRVLLNLVENALRHAPRGGRVEIAARRSAQGVTLSLDDSGPGIPPEARERVFERFARLGPPGERSGSGLGLALARAIARLHGGDLRVEDSPLGGARLVWWLPS